MGPPGPRALRDLRVDRSFGYLLEVSILATGFLQAQLTGSQKLRHRHANSTIAEAPHPARKLAGAIARRKRG